MRFRGLGLRGLGLRVEGLGFRGLGLWGLGFMEAFEGVLLFLVLIPRRASS